MKKLFEKETNYLHLLNEKHFKKGSIIFFEGDECNYVSVIKKGEISIRTFNYDKETEINLLHKDELFGDSLVLNSDNRYLGNVVAITDTILIMISKDNWLKLLENKTILKNYLEIVSSKVFKIQSRVKILSQKTIREKILFYLISEYKRTNNKEIKIKSKEALALYLNIPRPSLSRELILLKKDEIIDYNRYNITLLKTKDMA